MKKLVTLAMALTLITSSVGCCCFKRNSCNPCAAPSPCGPCGGGGGYPGYSGYSGYSSGGSCPGGACGASPSLGPVYTPQGAFYSDQNATSASIATPGAPVAAAAPVYGGPITQTAAMAPLNSLPTY